MDRQADPIENGYGTLAPYPHRRADWDQPPPFAVTRMIMMVDVKQALATGETHDTEIDLKNNRGSRSNETQFTCRRRCLDTVIDAQLAVNVLDVRLDRTYR